MITKMRTKWYTNVQGIPLPKYNKLMLVHTTTKLINIEVSTKRNSFIEA